MAKVEGLVHECSVGGSLACQWAELIRNLTGRQPRHAVYACSAGPVPTGVARVRCLPECLGLGKGEWMCIRRDIVGKMLVRQRRTGWLALACAGWRWLGLKMARPRARLHLPTTHEVNRPCQCVMSI